MNQGTALEKTSMILMISITRGAILFRGREYLRGPEHRAKDPQMNWPVSFFLR